MVDLPISSFANLGIHLCEAGTIYFMEFLWILNKNERWGKSISIKFSCYCYFFVFVVIIETEASVTRDWGQDVCVRNKGSCDDGEERALWIPRILLPTSHMIVDNLFQLFETPFFDQ